VLIEVLGDYLPGDQIDSFDPPNDEQDVSALVDNFPEAEPTKFMGVAIPVAPRENKPVETHHGLPAECQGLLGDVDAEPLGSAPSVKDNPVQLRDVRRPGRIFMHPELGHEDEDNPACACIHVQGSASHVFRPGDLASDNTQLRRIVEPRQLQQENKQSGNHQNRLHANRGHGGSPTQL
jgi:hypothetical protein